jgi:hypothetical protein
MKYNHCMRRKENRIAVREVCLVRVFSTATTKENENFRNVKNL